MIHADTSDIQRLAADLSALGHTRVATVRGAAVIEESLERIQADARQAAPKTRLPRYADTITHDVTIGGLGGSVAGEVGPDRSVNGQARLAHIFEYGAPKIDFAPRPHIGPAFDREIPNFLAAVEDAGGSIL